MWLSIFPIDVVASYRKSDCDNKEIRKDYVEEFVLSEALLNIGICQNTRSSFSVIIDKVIVYKDHFEVIFSVVLIFCSIMKLIKLGHQVYIEKHDLKH